MGTGAHGFAGRQLDGHKLRAARRRKGWSQSQLAVELGVSQSCVSCWESETKTPAAAFMLVGIAQVLGVKVAAISRPLDSAGVAA